MMFGQRIVDYGGTISAADGHVKQKWRLQTQQLAVFLWGNFARTSSSVPANFISPKQNHPRSLNTLFLIKYVSIPDYFNKKF
jgi:hypothetical protein